ncbi:MAG: hypothetical protein IKX03_06600 [Bacteroidales bacterium]|nr:hypothetical protein [Bacteroidales bacterium]
MKSLLIAALSAALFIIPFNSFAQAVEEEDEGNHMAVTIAPRLEGNIGAWTSDNQTYYQTSLASSMLYMILDGNFTDNLSLYGAIQLLNPNPAGLYGKEVIFNPQYQSFVNVLLLTYSLGPVDISFGKDALAFGGFEQEPDIIDTYWDVSSNSWYMIQPYLWGGRVTLNLGDQAPFFQIVDSPLKDRTFGPGGFCFFGGWDGQFFDAWQTKWSFGLMQTPEDGNIKILSLGNRWHFGDVQLTLDYQARSFDLSTLFNDEMTLVGDLRYCFPKIDVFSKFGWEFYHGSDESGYFTDFECPTWNIPQTILPNYLGPKGTFARGDYLFGSLGAEWYPLSDRRLRIHVIAAANNYYRACSLTAGVTYKFEFNLW